MKRSVSPAPTAKAKRSKKTAKLKSFVTPQSHPDGLGRKVKVPWPQDDDKDNLGTIWVDENGKGAFFGPMAVTAVYLHPGHGMYAHDSKRLPEAQRLAIWQAAQENDNVVFRTELTYAEHIDANGIETMWHESLKRAVRHVRELVGPERVHRVIIDGSKTVQFWDDEKLQVETLVKGDSQKMGIALASVIGKSVRDKETLNLAQEWESLLPLIKSCKGYGTKAHRDWLEQNGPTKHHRKTWLH